MDGNERTLNLRIVFPKASDVQSSHCTGKAGKMVKFPQNTGNFVRSSCYHDSKDTG